MSTAQWTLSIISGIPEKPSALPTCVSDILREFNQENANYTYYNNVYNY